MNEDDHVKCVYNVVLSEQIDSENAVVMVSDVVETPECKKEVVDYTQQSLEKQLVSEHKIDDLNCEVVSDVHDIESHTDVVSECRVVENMEADNIRSKDCGRNGVLWRRDGHNVSGEEDKQSCTAAATVADLKPANVDPLPTYFLRDKAPPDACGQSADAYAPFSYSRVNFVKSRYSVASDVVPTRSFERWCDERFIRAQTKPDPG